MRLTYVRLLVDNFGDCFRFYRDVMGFRPAYGDADGSYADFDAGADVELALFVRREMAEHVGGPAEAAGDRVALILSVDDVDAAFDEFRGRGAVVARPPCDRPDWGIRVAHLRDPDGNLIEINHALQTPA